MKNKKIKFIPLDNDEMIRQDIESMKRKKRFKQFASKHHKNNKNI